MSDVVETSNWRVFLDTMEHVTIPGLERRGLEARKAWDRACSAALAA